MPSAEALTALRTGKNREGQPLTQQETEALLKPYLPAPRAEASLTNSVAGTGGLHTVRIDRPSRWARPAAKVLVAQSFHTFIFYLAQLVFAVYIRTRQLYHALADQVFGILRYHNRTPQLIKQDVKTLSRLPKHLSIIVDLKSDESDEAHEEALSRLLGDVAELSAWCACAEIPLLSIYEQTGVLKSHIPSLHRAITRALRAYFPSNSIPTLQLRAPHHAAYSPPVTPSQSPDRNQANLNVLLLSASDGRETLVDLTKTLAEMSQRKKLSVSDISADLINAEVTESSCDEPDLLVLMASDSRPYVSPKHLGRYVNGSVCLRGYPPWQVRLTEIVHVKDTHGVSYQVFLRALYQYANAEMRFGR